MPSGTGLLAAVEALSGSNALAAQHDGSGDASEVADDNFDWSSVEQVTALVSKTTLAGLQQQWKTHAGQMDQYGRTFAENMYNAHSQVIKDIASVKNFEVKPVTALLNTFTDRARELVMAVFAHMRAADDAFAQQVYQSSRLAFSRNLRAALEARDAWYRDKLKAIRSQHEAQLASLRAANIVEASQRSAQMRLAVARVLSKVPQALAAAQPGHAAGAGSAAAPSTRSSATTLAFAASAVSGGNDYSAQLGLGPDGLSGLHLEALLEEASASDTLHRSLQEQLGAAQAQLADMHAKVESAEREAAEATAAASEWRSKYTVESTKTDSVKREAMAIISQCEQHVSRLQQQHINELGKRDTMLQRAKDTISNMEGQLAALGASVHGDTAFALQPRADSSSVRWGQ